MVAVPTEGLAGQEVAVMPLTLVATDPAFQADSLFAPYRDRRTTLTWADSLIGEAFVGARPGGPLDAAPRAPEGRAARAGDRRSIPTRWARRCCARPR